MTIEHDGKCEDCNNRVLNRRAPLVSVGESVRSLCDNMAGETEYQFAQCPNCGLMWTKYRDYGGVVDSDTFYRLLIDNL